MLSAEPLLSAGLATRFGGRLAADVVERLAGPAPALVADREAARAAMLGYFGEEAATAALSRAAAIVLHPEAKGREGQAHHIAFKTNLSVEQAASALAHGGRFAEPSAIKGPRLAIINPRLSPFGDDGGPAPSADDGWAAVAEKLNAELKR